MLAYCFASGQIEFGRRKPKGAIVIARGEASALHDFICSVSRHGYSTESVGGRRTKIPGSDTLLVPGVPEAEATNDQSAKGDALEKWLTWIAQHAPAGVTVNLACKRGVPSEAAVRSDRTGPATPSELAGAAQ
jgi:hypothetical protein